LLKFSVIQIIISTRFFADPMQHNPRDRPHSTHPPSLMKTKHPLPTLQKPVIGSYMDPDKFQPQPIS